MTCLDSAFFFPVLFVQGVCYVNTTPKKVHLSHGPSTTNPKECPVSSISFPDGMVWPLGFQPGRELSRLLSNWESRGHLFGVPIPRSRCKKCKVKVKIPSLPQLISHTTSNLIAIYVCLFCVHPRLQSLLVQEFIPFSVRVPFVRLVFDTHASHRIFLPIESFCGSYWTSRPTPRWIRSCFTH